MFSSKNLHFFPTEERKTWTSWMTWVFFLFIFLSELLPLTFQRTSNAKTIVLMYCDHD